MSTTKKTFAEIATLASVSGYGAAALHQSKAASAYADDRQEKLALVAFVVGVASYILDRMKTPDRKLLEELLTASVMQAFEPANGKDGELTYALVAEQARSQVAEVAKLLALIEDGGLEIPKDATLN